MAEFNSFRHCEEPEGRRGNLRTCWGLCRHSATATLRREEHPPRNDGIFFFLISLFIITSCAPTVQPVAAEQLPEPTQTPLVATLEPTVKPMVLPIPTATQTSCDPFTEDFCITEGNFIFKRPIKSPANDSIDQTYRYGSTQNNTRDPHHGVDMENPIGTPVYAAGDGTVIFAGPDKEAIYSPWASFYGNVIVIKHEDNLFTLYGHLSKIDIKTGQIVNAGDKIGEVGKGGVAIGSHLHFEIRRGNDGEDYFSTLNPELWMTPKMDKTGKPLGALAVSIIDAAHKFIKFLEFTARYHLNPDSPKIKSYYVTTYPLNMANDGENAALSELAPGYYRIALKVNGHVYDRWVEVKSGKLAQVVFVVK